MCAILHEKERMTLGVELREQCGGPQRAKLWVQRVEGPCGREADWLWPEGSVIMSVLMFFLVRCLHRQGRLPRRQTAKLVTLTVPTGS